MIDLLATEDRTGFGIAAALDIERIPYRRIARLDDCSGHLLLIAGVPVAPAARARRVPTIVIGGPTPLARELFGVEAGETASGPAAIPLAADVWPAAVRAEGTRFGKDALRLPWAPVFTPAAPPVGETLATVRRADGCVQPAVVAAGDRLWCLVDIGAALANLLDESYVPAPANGRGRPLPAILLALYYRAPDALRRVLQRRIYARLHEGLARRASPSDYPVDATGWLLLELVKALVRRAAGGLVRLAHWPAPYAAAAALTHDLEPSRFAYTKGLDRLTRQIAAGGHPATLGIVARPAARHLGPEAVDGLRRHDVLCHGLEHRGETLVGSREDVACGLDAARSEVEATLGRAVTGFRSPRLDRSRTLLWALDRAGFGCDSSYPDVDRENVDSFGAGVRLNLPFHPPIDEGGNQVRPSGCLELPVSAPDCIQPLFEGADVPALRQAVDDKIAFVQATGGLYVGIVHAGVFGSRDAARRGDHLDFVRRRLARPDLWLATVRDIADWWCARERLVVSLTDDGVRVTNCGERTLALARLIVERDGVERVYELPALASGESVTVEHKTDADRAAVPA